jgi:hypothetical protein
LNATKTSTAVGPKAMQRVAVPTIDGMDSSTLLANEAVSQVHIATPSR